jgi:hypothetical protein
MKKIKLLAPIKHDGKDYKAGDSLEITEAQAKRLVSLGFAEITGDVEIKTQPPTTTQTPATNSAGGGAELGIEEIELMSMDKLKQELSLRNIKFHSNSNKLELLKLLKEAISNEATQKEGQ